MWNIILDFDRQFWRTDVGIVVSGTKQYTSVRINLAGGLDYLCLVEYPWITTCWCKLKMPVLQAMHDFPFTACKNTKSREQCCQRLCRLRELRSRDL